MLSSPIPDPHIACFVGVDIAAKSFTVALLLPGAKPKLEPKPFNQDADGFAQFMAQLQARGVAPQQYLIVMEATGPYWVALAVSLASNGYGVSVVNPAQVHYFAKAQLRQAKSDRLDALTLAEFAQTMHPKAWNPPPQFDHELRQRISQRDNLLKFHNQVVNQLHALSVNPVIINSVQHQLEELRTTLESQIEQMDQELKQLLSLELEQVAPESEQNQPLGSESEEQWKKNIALLRTIPGIGPLTACWLVLTTLNFTTCASPEALVHYAGLAPLEYSSGTSIRARPQIGHSGNGRLRTFLYMGTLTAARYNPTIKAFYDRLRQEQHKPVKVARCACARKMLHLVFAIIKSGQPYQATYQACKEKVA
jgi:transposase